jgi:hypothetical protein
VTSARPGGLVEGHRVPEAAAGALVAAAGAYAGLGALFAIPFVLRGVDRIDRQARGATLGFRLLILPAAAALWPRLAWRWARGLPPPEERNPHRDRARRPGLPAGAGE